MKISGNRYMLIWFIICLSLGVMSLVISFSIRGLLFTFYIPVGLMVLYMAIALRNSSFDTMNINIADSIYLLGFLFTVFGLTALLFDLQDSKLSMNIIGPRFSMCLITTFIGLAIRVSIVCFRENIENIEKKAELKLSHKVSKFDAHLGLCIDKVKKFDKGILDDISKTNIEMSNSMNNCVQKLENSALQIKKQIDQTSGEIVTLNNKLIDNLNGAIETNSSKLEKSANNCMQTLSKNFEEFSTKVSTALLITTTKINNIEIPEDIFRTAIEAPLLEMVSTINKFNEKLNAIHVSKNIIEKY